MASLYEAAQVYVQLAESIDNKLVENVLKSLADEERIHMGGEFLRLLQEITSGEKKFLSKGAKAVLDQLINWEFALQDVG